MKKEFVPYELALELKDLGFDEPCFRFKNNISNVFEQKIEGYDWNQVEKFVSISTFSQAFRFFREKYSIESHIKSFYQQRENKGFYFGIDDYINKDFYSSPYYSYEEAELECLKKLIEIAKDQNLK